MGGSLNQPFRVQEEGLMGCKLLLNGTNPGDEIFGMHVLFE